MEKKPNGIICLIFFQGLSLLLLTLTLIDDQQSKCFTEEVLVQSPTALRSEMRAAVDFRVLVFRGFEYQT